MCQANGKSYIQFILILYTIILIVVLFISICDRLYNNPLGLALEMPALSFVCNRLWVGFGGLLGELPLLLLVLRGCGPKDYHIYLTEVTTLLWVHLY